MATRTVEASEGEVLCKASSLDQTASDAAFLTASEWRLERACTPAGFERRRQRSGLAGAREGRKGGETGENMERGRLGDTALRGHTETGSGLS